MKARPIFPRNKWMPEGYSIMGLDIPCKDGDLIYNRISQKVKFNFHSSISGSGYIDSTPRNIIGPSPLWCILRPNKPIAVKVAHIPKQPNIKQNNPKEF